MRRRPQRAVMLGLVALAAAGCTRNARLELGIELPPATDIAAAELLVLSDPPDFDGAAWNAVDAEPLEELGEVATVHVLADGEAIDRPLGLRVRLCPSAPCPAVVPEVRLRLERAFFRGRSTWLTVHADPAPAMTGPPIDVRRCQLGGCLFGDETDEFCRMDGTHYCDPPQGP